MSNNDAWIAWLEAAIDEYADGSIPEFTRLLGFKGRGTVYSWLKDNNKPSAVSCQRLVDNLPITMTVEEIAEMAGSQWKHGSGNRRRDRGEYVNRPARQAEDDRLEFVVWENVVQGNACLGCSRRNLVENPHEDRRAVCDALADMGMAALCEPITLTHVKTMLDYAGGE